MDLQLGVHDSMVSYIYPTRFIPLHIGGNTDAEDPMVREVT